MMMYYRITLFVMLILFTVANVYVVNFLVEGYPWYTWIVNIIAEIIFIVLLIRASFWVYRNGGFK